VEKSKMDTEKHPFNKINKAIYQQQCLWTGMIILVKTELALGIGGVKFLLRD